MKTYLEVEKRFGSTFLPLWYDQDIHSTIMSLLSGEGGKLYACKYLRETSNDLRKSYPKYNDLVLTEAKEICDFIKDDVVLDNKPFLEKIQYQINSAINVAEARFTNDANAENVFKWLQEETNRIFAGETLYE